MCIWRESKPENGTYCQLKSLHRSQIFKEFVSDAGSGSGILRLGRTIPLLFGEKIFKTVCFNSVYFKSGP
jgi:hypothetical protein